MMEYIASPSENHLVYLTFTPRMGVDEVMWM